MPSNTKRSCRDAEMRVERIKYKFVNEYVKHLHKDTYMKAKDLYNKIRKIYSNGVKDITKTVEFMEATNQKIIPRHYARKRKAEVEMVLRIPLMSLSPPVSSVSSTAVSSSTTESLSPSLLSDNTFEQLMAQPTTESLSPSLLSDNTFEQLMAQPTTESLSPLLLSDNTFEQLMAELQNDPDLAQILDDFPDNGIYNQDDDVLYETMQDSMTPLERELSLY